MTTVVNALTHDGITRQLAVLHNEHPAARMVRASFNPSKLSSVDDLKLLAAAFIAKCDEVASLAKISETLTVDEQQEVGRAMALAKTNAQQACMHAVFGATAGL